MKKFIISALAAIGLLLSPSCSDENEVLSGSDNEALVSFNVNLADGISTKAGDGSYTIGKGHKVNKLRVLVYESADNKANGDVAGHISDLDKEVDIVVGTPEIVSFSLVKGKTYHFLFWAQYEDEAGVWKSPYEFGEGGTVTIDYSKNGSGSPLSNDERYDAFVATETRTITTDISFNVKLTRPFAQLNFLTTKEDIKKAAAGRIIPGSNFSGESLNSIVRIDNVATKLDPFKKTVSAPKTVTFAANATRFTITRSGADYKESNFDVAEVGTNNTVSITPQGASTAETYYYLATNYFLVNTGGDEDARATLTSATLEIKDSNFRPLKLTSIPVQQNYRTNIYGDLLTAGGTFNVTIDNEFGGSDENVPTTASVSSLEDLKTALGNANIATITLTDDIALTEDLTIDRNVTIDGQNQTYGFTGAGSVVVKAQAEDAVTFSGVIFNNAADEAAGTDEKYALTSVQGIQCDVTVENCVFANYTYGAVFLQPYFYPSGSGECSTILIEGNSFTTPSSEKHGDYLSVCSTTTQNGNLRNEWTGGGTTNEPVTATLKILNNTFGQTETMVRYAIYTNLISRYSTYVGGNKIDENETFDIFKTKLFFRGASDYSLPSDFQSMFTGGSATPLETMPGT